MWYKLLNNCALLNHLCSIIKEFYYNFLFKIFISNIFFLIEINVQLTHPLNYKLLECS